MQGKKVIIKLALLISILGLTACSDDKVEKPEVIRPVRAIKVAGDVQFAGRDFPGRAKATNEVNLAFDVGGTLKQRPVNVGDNVKKGQLIASLDPRDFESTVKEARAGFINADANFKRAEKLIKKNFISKADYDRLYARKLVTSAELEKAKKAMADSVMKAPFDGYISVLPVENFQSVLAKEQVARLVDISQIEMIIDIPESTISMVRYAVDIKVVFDAFPSREVPATIKEIATEASLTTRTFPVTLIMDQPEDIKILPGMAGKARGRVSDDAPQNKSQNKGIQIPVSAAYSPEEDDNTYVWLINEETGEVHRQVVSLGKVISSGLVITEGVNPGDWVVTAGVHFLREGQKVKIMQGKGK